MSQGGRPPTARALKKALFSEEAMKVESPSFLEAALQYRLCESGQQPHHPGRPRFLTWKREVRTSTITILTKTHVDHGGVPLCAGALRAATFKKLLNKDSPPPSTTSPSPASSLPQPLSPSGSLYPVLLICSMSVYSQLKKKKRQRSSVRAEIFVYFVHCSIPRS